MKGCFFMLIINPDSMLNLKKQPNIIKENTLE